MKYSKYSKCTHLSYCVIPENIHTQPQTSSMFNPPPPLPSEIPEYVTPIPSEFHNIMTPPPTLQNFRFFLEVHFQLGNICMNKWTWIYASSRQWSSGARRQALLFSNKKSLPRVAWLCKLLFKSNYLAVKVNTTCGNFHPLSFLVLFRCLQSRTAQI